MKLDLKNLTRETLEIDLPNGESVALMYPTVEMVELMQTAGADFDGENGLGKSFDLAAVLISHNTAKKEYTGEQVRDELGFGVDHLTALFETYGEYIKSAKRSKN